MGAAASNSCGAGCASCVDVALDLPRPSLPPELPRAAQLPSTSGLAPPPLSSGGVSVMQESTEEVRRAREFVKGEGLFVLPDTPARSRKLEDYFDLLPLAAPSAVMGRGHYGMVRRATRKADGVPVAVKVIAKKRAVYVDMIASEVAILRSLKTVPSVITLLDEFEDATSVYLILEIAQGGELFEPIADPEFNFTEQQAARLMRKLLLAVKSFHDRNVVHRDIKPENLLLTEDFVDGDLKVIDFGLATQHVPGAPPLTRHVGTPYYVAPQVLEKSYGRECDMWSVGVVCFAVLCGFPPFWGDTDKDIYARIRAGRFWFAGALWGTRSYHCKDFVSNLLTWDAAQRYTVDAALAHPWIVGEGTVFDTTCTGPALLTALWAHATSPWVKRAAKVIAVRKLEKEGGAELRPLRAIFDGLQLKNGVLDTMQLAESLCDKGAPLSPSDAARLFVLLDVTGAGTITPTTFCAALLPRLWLTRPGLLASAFHELDEASGDGVLSGSDLAAWGQGGEGGGADAAAAEVGEGGVITLAEFMVAVLGNGIPL